MNETAGQQVLIVTGEVSGERYAAQVAREFALLYPGAGVSFFGSGGDAMRQAGIEIIADIHSLEAIGPVEALKLGPNYWRLWRRILFEARRRDLRLALLVDFPDFNLRLARRLKRRGTCITYYISPTVWAWRAGRIDIVRRFVDRMLCIFPFEEKLYRSAGVTAEYVGHPLVNMLDEVDPPAVFRQRYNLAPDETLISVLPGSRLKEIRHILPHVLDALVAIRKEIPGARFLIPTPSAGIRKAVQEELAVFFHTPREPLRGSDIRVVENDASNCLANSRLGIVKSGTATLQAALAGTPFVMVYRTSPLTWLLGRFLVGNRQFCIANLIAGREIVPELLQDHARGPEIARTFLNIFHSPDIYTTMRQEVLAVGRLLGSRNAPRRVAEEIMTALRQIADDSGGNA